MQRRNSRLGGLILVGVACLPITRAGENDPLNVRGDSSFPIRNPVDSYVLHKLNEAKISPSQRCSDEEFIRRAYLDVCGVIPTGDAVKAFACSSNSDAARSDAHATGGRTSAPASTSNG